MDANFKEKLLEFSEKIFHICRAAEQAGKIGDDWGIEEIHLDDDGELCISIGYTESYWEAGERQTYRNSYPIYEHELEDPIATADQIAKEAAEEKRREEERLKAQKERQARLQQEITEKRERAELKRLREKYFGTS